MGELLADPKAIHVVGAAILDGRRCLVAQRGSGMSLSGRWEFPGGKVERGEDPAAALTRELEEELGIRARVEDWLGRGESVSGDVPVELDVYAASGDLEALRLREHRRVRWVDERELYELDWAEPDVPILPAVKARMRRAFESHQSCNDIAVLSADWGKEASKRAVYAAVREGCWSIRRECPPAGGWSLSGVLNLARRLRDETERAVLVGIDVVLGLPNAYTRAIGLDGFLDAVTWLERSGGLIRDSDSPGDWSPDRPFFRVPKGGRARFEAAAGGKQGLLRQIERRTGAKPVFILAGIPGTVGSGSRALWKELARQLEERTGDFKLWPFEGDLAGLTASANIVLAEIYPRAAYALALSPALPARPMSIGKTKLTNRSAALEGLARMRWLSEVGVELHDRESALRNEDHFDAFFTAAALVRLVAAGHPLSCDLVDSAAEGGILPTGMLDLSKPGFVLGGVGEAVFSRGLEGRGLRCPIPGCGKVFRQGRLGWDAHVGPVAKHPDWYPDIDHGDRRKDLFRKDFASWFQSEG